jgi:two-component system NtrC family sensor kinase
MVIFGRISKAVRETVRYKLLVLVLFPILLVMPIVLALAIYWGAKFTYDQLFIKVNTDLTVADDIFGRIREDYLNRLGRLAESYVFRTALDASNADTIQQQLSELKAATGFTYLHVIDISGNRLYEENPTGRSRSSSSLLTAAQGVPIVGVEIFSAKDLAAEDPFLARNNELILLETPHARPTERTIEDRGMMIRAIYPVKLATGKIVALLDGGVLLNGNFDFVDAIRDLAYGPGSLLKGSIGTVTVFLDDVRITTNVPLRPGERALGTRVSDEVRSRVLDQGEIWIDRAFVVNDWYISAYEPILDETGKRVGMLYTGYLEAPYRISLWQALAVLVFMFVVLMVLSSMVAIRGAKSIFKPLEAMTKVVHATRSGEAQRIGQVASKDEIGELAREFDVMLDLLEERSRQVLDWADQLEDKVAERTAELQRKNADLLRTIRVLRETRQQLVVAEKLAALGELTAGVAHEINNPTQVMLGNLDVIMAELGPALEPVQNEVELIIQQIYRIQEIINNLLQYARPNEFAGYLTEVDINALVADTLKLVQHMRKGSSFSIELDLKASYRIKINQQELQQVLVNLIVNAIHAVQGRNGNILVMSHDWDERGVMICVKDNGVGMDEEQLGRIFNPFYSTKGQGEGSGLGLSVSYGLIRRYGGNISVKSTPGEGAEFTIWLLREPELIEDEATITEQLHAIEANAELTTIRVVRTP